jgi:hypothetical protein
MTRFTGQIVRTAGIFIEMLGILALVFRSSTDEAGNPLPGSFSRTQVWAVIGCGFVVWLFGSIVTYWPRKPRGKGSESDGAEGRLRL